MAKGSYISIKDKDIAYKHLLKTNEEFKKSSVVIGILSDAPDPEGAKMNMATLGAIHEFGSKITITDKMRGWFKWQGFPLSPQKKVITIPARPFMGSTFDRIKNKIFEMVKSSSIKIYSKKSDVRNELLRLGQFSEDQVKQTFTKNNFQPLSEMTLALRKKGSAGGSPRPLIDTGRLRASIRNKVEMGKGGAR